MSEIQSHHQQQSQESLSEGRVFVGGINKATTAEALRRCFDRYGVVTDLFYPVDDRGLQKGFAIVTYENIDG
jgi:RNA recognition motif-containing protein